MRLLAHCTDQVAHLAAHVLSWSLAGARKLQLSIFAAESSFVAKPKLDFLDSEGGAEAS